MKKFTFEELETATNNFSQSQIIGKGSHGKIYEGVLKNNNLVAIKKQSSTTNSKLENEAKILSSLPTTNPYLINLLGISHDHENNKILVLEHMANKTLHDLLHDSIEPPTWPKRLTIALQIAKAVHFLHELSPIVVHRDIKSSNVLFDGSWNAKLADLGLGLRISDSREDKRLSCCLPAGTIGYIDPEYTTPTKVSTKIDVFSYGVLLLELLSGRKVIDVSRTPSWIVEWVVGLIERRRGAAVFDPRVEVPRCMESVVERLLDVAIRCVSTEEKRRPSMREVVADLERLVVVMEEVPIRVRLSVVMLNSLREIVVNLRRRKLGATKCDVAVKIKGGGACAEDGGEGGGVLKGTVLFRDLLADLT